jgi:hypothetical protein
MSLRLTMMARASIVAAMLLALYAAPAGASCYGHPDFLRCQEREGREEERELRERARERRERDNDWRDRAERERHNQQIEDKADEIIRELRRRR